MASFQVTCHTPDDLNAECRIKGLGGLGWWFHTGAIIEIIEQRQHEFWVLIDDRQVELTVGSHGGAGRKFITTASGEFPPKNLLILPICSLMAEAGKTSDKSRWASVP